MSEKQRYLVCFLPGGDWEVIDAEDYADVVMWATDDRRHINYGREGVRIFKVAEELDTIESRVYGSIVETQTSRGGKVKETICFDLGHGTRTEPREKQGL